MTANAFTGEERPASAAMERIRSTFERQRQAALRTPYPSLAQRRDNLRRLRGAMKRHQDDIADAIYEDFGGRSPFESRLIEVLGPVLEISHALRHLRRWMRPRRRSTELLFLTNRARVQYQPKGVVGIIAPWNFPIYTSVGPLIAALAAGDRAMIKMSELVPHATEALARIIGEEFDPDEVAVFGGALDESRFFAGRPFDHLVFTGSPAVGKQVMRGAADNLTPVTLELGGKSPVIVAPGASIGHAARIVAHGKAFNGGQTCVAPDYCLVPRADLEAFSEAVIAAFRKLYPTVAANRDYTAIVSDHHARRIEQVIDDARRLGARIIASGASGDDRRFPLHVLSGVSAEMRATREELFAPLLPIIPYDTVDEAIAYVSARERPLALYPIGFRRHDLARVLERTHSGGVCVGDWGWHAFNHDLPFGGTGNSGMGSYHGEEGFRELSHARAVFTRWSWFPVQLFYPPYGTFVHRLVMRLFLGQARAS
jgi:coniferyl-aldehyde dehydrogenase